MTMTVKNGRLTALNCQGCGRSGVFTITKTARGWLGPCCLDQPSEGGTTP
jgi:hypothetical protein